jgi:4-diphosphocytidyl-2C-methyl-D-erythritol kinase
MGAFKEEGAIAVNMTGSGPSVYAYFSSESEGQRAVLNLQKHFPECRFYCTETHNE